MAQYDYTPDINPLDDEEERKRREAAIAAMAGENAPMGRGPIEPTFGEILSQGFDKRIGDAQNRIAQAGQMFSDPATALRQRMMGEQRQAAQDEAADTEVKTQTVKTYQDGSQERVVKTQVPAGQAQESGGARLTTPIAGMPQNLPNAGPISPEDAQRQIQMAQMPQAGASAQVAGATQMPPQPQAQPRPQPQAQPAMGQMPPANYGMATGQAPTGIRMPQAQPPAAVAAAPGASLAQAGQVAQAQPVAGTPFTPTAEREVAQPKLWVQAANDAGSDLAKLFDVAANHPESRDMIVGKMELALKNKTKEDAAKKLFEDAAGGSLKAQNEIFQNLRPEKGKPKEEITTGDYVKAILYKRLGLDALALDVQNKIIGKETKFGQVSLGGSNWEIETDPSGQIIRAKDENGVIATESTLNKLRAGAQKFGSQAFGFTGEANTIPQGQADAGQEYRQRTNSISGAIENVITTGPNANKIYSGPPGSAKSVGTSYSKALNDAFIKYKTKPELESATKMREIAVQVDSGDGKTIAAVDAQIRQMTPQIFNQITGGQAGTPPAPTGVGGTAAPGTSIDPNAVARTDRDIAELDRQIVRATQSTAIDPARKAQQLQVLNDERNRLLTAKQNMTPAGVPVQAAPAQGGGVGVGGGSLASQLKTQTEAAQEVGTDLGKIKVNQPKTEANADYLITRINELITHPGFETSVGRKGISYGFGLTKDPIFAGTDAADWQARFKEVGGQSFLQAIENLRGLGALSNLEGESATKAIQRMSTSQSEKEFKTAAQDFNEIIQRGVDRNREKLGQAPKYSTPSASESAKQTEAAKPKKLSADDKKALEWARQNPNTPEAAQVKQRLGL